MHGMHTLNKSLGLLDVVCMSAKLIQCARAAHRWCMHSVEMHWCVLWMEVLYKVDGGALHLWSASVECTEVHPQVQRDLDQDVHQEVRQEVHQRVHEQVRQEVHEGVHQEVHQQVHREACIKFLNVHSP